MSLLGSLSPLLLPSLPYRLHPRLCLRLCFLTMEPDKYMHMLLYFSSTFSVFAVVLRGLWSFPDMLSLLSRRFPPCWSFESEMLLSEKGGVFHLCNSSFYFHHFSNSVSVTAWNCLNYPGLRVTYYYLYLQFIEHQELAWNFSAHDIWCGQWLRTSGNTVKNKQVMVKYRQGLS